MGFRLTPARRDFLRLFCFGPVEVTDNGGRFLAYTAKGQLNKRISRRNFKAIVDAGYLQCREVMAEDKFVTHALWEATAKARELFPEIKGV